MVCELGGNSMFMGIFSPGILPLNMVVYIFLKNNTASTKAYSVPLTDNLVAHRRPVFEDLYIFIQNKFL